MAWILHHKIIFVGIIIVVAGGVWFGLNQNPSSSTSLLTNVTPASTGSPTLESADQELLATLLTLRSVTLSGTIFEDPVFTTLRDFGTTIVAEPIGRPNPFVAPSGVSRSPQSSQQQGAPGARR